MNINRHEMPAPSSSTYSVDAENRLQDSAETIHEKSYWFS
jgi:hypothetical protein